MSEELKEICAEIEKIHIQLTAIMKTVLMIDGRLINIEDQEPIYKGTSRSFQPQAD